MRCQVIDISSSLRETEVVAICHSADAFIFLFDLGSRNDDFQVIRKNLQIIKKLDTTGDKPMLLCGNKVDLPATKRQVHVRSAAGFAKQQNLDNYYEMSTWANHNITEPFEFVAKLVEYRKTGRHLRVKDHPKVAPPQVNIPHFQELINNETIIASLIPSPFEVVEERVHDHSPSQIRDRFMRKKVQDMVGFDRED